MTTAAASSLALADSVLRNERSGLAEIPRIDICGSVPWPGAGPSAAVSAGSAAGEPVVLMMRITVLVRTLQARVACAWPSLPPGRPGSLHPF